MSQVLANRDENWKKLQQYLLDERERIQVLGTGQPLCGDETNTSGTFGRILRPEPAHANWRHHAG